ncbi:dynein axonemal heavy chain 12 isoform X3 [Nerophis lumbriciformis]|uniref:dynein axonemal heavy chain 12 isoform X3 n=1 Tax=Nerophis lumbriciformis TaxID=546530 RepID=UPI002AE006C6|nr:dynein axonemal heavy chain 12-like isoform X3 [Nerophis lumbriciformis]
MTSEEKANHFESSDDDLDEDEATQYIIEQSLFEYRKLKGLNPSELKVSQDPDEIFKAIKKGDEDALQQLTAHPEILSRVNEHGWIPLHEAAVQESKHILEIIFSASPSGTAQCRTLKGETPLFLAVVYGRRQNATFLLQNGCNPNLQDDEQDSPLVAGANVECESESGTVLFDAAASGNPDIISLLLDHGADANVPLHSGHLPIHRVAYHGHILALQHLIPVTKPCAIKESGMSPLHSAAAGGHSHCVELLLKAGFDPNLMLHPRVRRKYDDERKSALFFAVSNNDLQSTRLLLEAGAMVNQDPISCLQVALRHGNYELINTLLRFGANVNYYSRVNTTHFPSALQYAINDEVMLRMILNYGYDVKRCFDCPYGDSCHNFAPWTTPVIKDMVFCEVITVSWLRHLSAQVVRIMLDYTDHVSLCAKLGEALQKQTQWLEICHIQRNARNLKHLCRLQLREHLHCLGLRASIFINFLPLPTTLKEYLCYKEFDVYTRGSVAI